MIYEQGSPLTLPAVKIRELPCSKTHTSKAALQSCYPRTHPMTSASRRSASASSRDCYISNTRAKKTRGIYPQGYSTCLAMKCLPTLQAAIDNSQVYLPDGSGDKRTSALYLHLPLSSFSSPRNNRTVITARIIGTYPHPVKEGSKIA